MIAKCVFYAMNMYYFIVVRVILMILNHCFTHAKHDSDCHTITLTITGIEGGHLNSPCLKTNWWNFTIYVYYEGEQNDKYIIDSDINTTSVPLNISINNTQIGNAKLNVTFVEISQHLIYIYINVTQSNKTIPSEISIYEVYINTGVCAFLLIAIAVSVVILATRFNYFSTKDENPQTSAASIDEVEEIADHEDPADNTMQVTPELDTFVVITPAHTEGIPANVCYVTPTDLEISRQRLRPVRKSHIFSAAMLRPSSALRSILMQATRKPPLPPCPLKPLLPPRPCKTLTSSPQYVNVEDGYIKMTLSAKSSLNSNGYVEANGQAGQNSQTRCEITDIYRPVTNGCAEISMMVDV